MTGFPVSRRRYCERMRFLLLALLLTPAAFAWNLDAVRLPQAQALLAGRTLAPVTVAVLDTGHVPGSGLRGPDFVSDPVRAGDGDGRDPFGDAVGRFAFHGDGVARIVMAVNPAARVLHVRVAGEDGLIELSDLMDGMRWAAGLPVPGMPRNTNPARVLNLSLYADFIPLTGCHPDMAALMRELEARNVLVVVGAGNSNLPAARYTPAGCAGALTVAALTRSGARADYASYGPAVSLGAPGGDSAHPLPLPTASGVQAQQGSSFAAPHASGVASLLLSLRPELGAAELRRVLVDTALPYPGGCDPLPERGCGSGALNAEAALRAVLIKAP